MATPSGNNIQRIKDSCMYPEFERILVEFVVTDAQAAVIDIVDRLGLKGQAAITALSETPEMRRDSTGFILKARNSRVRRQSVEGPWSGWPVPGPRAMTILPFGHCRNLAATRTSLALARKPHASPPRYGAQNSRRPRAANTGSKPDGLGPAL
jgi:hypothetical protein